MGNLDRRRWAEHWRRSVLGWLVVALAVIVSAAPPPVDLLPEAQWQYSIDEGATYHPTPPKIGGGVKAPVWARTEFELARAGGFAALELSNDLIPSLEKIFFLNERPIPPLQPVMYYNRYPALDPGLLRPGRNVLTARVVVDARRRDVTFQPKIGLWGLLPESLAIEIGPVLGALGPDWFTVTCRTNMKVPVRVVSSREQGRERVTATSPAGVFHRFRIPRGREDGTRFALAAVGSEVRHEFTAPLWPDPARGRLRFVVTSDPQSSVPQWTAVAKAILGARPDFVVFGGDLIGAGRDDDAWGPEFFAPAGELFARVPAYTVQGNHEGQAPVVEEYFHGPAGDGRSRHWVQNFGDVTLIGIDQWIHLDWEPGSENVRWFERTLAAAEAKFLFVVTHYPAYSSCSHGKVDAAGVPVEREIRRARQVLVPLLERHRVTALLAGHDHYYERTELPSGLLQIITGGAGRATDGQSREARRQNPYSKFHAAQNHYSLIEVAGGRCGLTAIRPDGSVIEKVEFRPRR